MIHKNSNKRKRNDLPFEHEMEQSQNKMTKVSEDSITFLSNSKYQAKECGGGGNCLFLLISFLLGKKKGNGHKSLRKKTCDYIEKNICQFEGSLEYENNPQEYITKMRRSGVWGGHPEIKALAKILKRSIHIYESKFSKSRKLIGFQLKAQEDIINITEAPLLLHHIHETHYQVIIPHEKIEIKLKSKPAETNSNKISKENSKPQSSTPSPV